MVPIYKGKSKGVICCQLIQSIPQLKIFLSFVVITNNRIHIPNLAQKNTLHLPRNILSFLMSAHFVW